MLIDVSLSGLTDKFIFSGKVQKKLQYAHELLHGLDKSIGTGWVELPSETTKSEINNIKQIAKEIQDKCDLFLVVGIGGAQRGAQAALEIFKKQNAQTEVKFVGTSFDYSQILEVLEDAKKREVCVNVISKSGETLETLLTFHIIEEFMKKKYKKGEYKNRIYITTDYESGRLREVSAKEGYKSFIFPRTIGGRYSLFSIVGLLPMAVGGINIEKFVGGAKVAELKCTEMDCKNNMAYKLAVARYFLNAKKGKKIEVVSSFNAKLKGFFKWYEQLFLESEGKNKKGLFVSSLNYPSDLHSTEQFIQDGSPIMFETIIDITKQNADISFQNLKESDYLYSLNGLTLCDIENASKKGVENARKLAGVPIINITLEELIEEAFGELAYTLMLACATYCYLLDIDPFNQPAVEKYKKETRKILKI